jgi:hypothetical protein
MKLAYSIQTVTLSSQYKTTTAPAGLVYTKADISNFIDDYRSGRHTERFMLLSEPLSGEFLEHSKGSDRGLLLSFVGFAASVATGFVPGMAAAGAGLFRSGPGKNLSTDAFNRIESICAWSKQTPFRYNCGRVGITI